MDILALSDEEILDLTTVKFVDNETQSYELISLDDITVISPTTFQYNGSNMVIPEETIRKLIIKKTKYNLIKSNLDIKNISAYINDEIKKGIEYHLEHINKTFEVSLNKLETQSNTINSIINQVKDLNQGTSVLNDKQTKMLEQNTKNLGEFNKVIEKLKFLIEE